MENDFNNNLVTPIPHYVGEEFRPPPHWFYDGIYNLRKKNIKYPYSERQITEINKCLEPQTGIFYFFNNYLTTLSLDEASYVPFIPRGYQVDMINNMMNYRFNIFKNPRQSGKTTLTAGVYVYLMNFFPYEICGIVANKDDIAVKIVGLMQTMYKNLPFWMQQGVYGWPKTEFELENGSRVLARATSADALSGHTIKNLFWDEVAKVRKNLAEDFISSVYPTISSSTKSKITLSSTPKGYNQFAKFWFDAVNGKNEFHPIEVSWNAIPGRDEAFKKQTIANIGEAKWNEDYECVFAGSANTLISGTKLQQLFHVNPIKTFFEEKFKIYDEPVREIKDHSGKIIQNGHNYAIIADVSEGKNEDYYTINVVDLSTCPYRQVAVYRDNIISYLMFPSVMDEIIKIYGEENCLTIIEVNHGFGRVIADTLMYDLGTNSMMYSDHPKKEPGLRMTTKSKKIGCGSLRTLIEYDKIIIQDFDTIDELFNFISDKNSFKADEGHTDDCVMGLVFFGYVVSTKFIDQFTDSNLSFRQKFFSEQENAIRAEMPAFGYISRGGMDEIDNQIDDTDPEKLCMIKD
jgi:hypothetical protein